MSSSCFLSPSLARARTRFIVYRSMRIAAAAAVSQHTAGGWPSLNCSLFSNTTNVDKWIFRIFLFFFYILVLRSYTIICYIRLYTSLLRPSSCTTRRPWSRPTPADGRGGRDGFARRRRRRQKKCGEAPAIFYTHTHAHTHRRYTRNIISANQLPGILSYDAYIPIRRGTVVVLRV